MNQNEVSLLVETLTNRTVAREFGHLQCRWSSSCTSNFPAWPQNWQERQHGFLRLTVAEVMRKLNLFGTGHCSLEAVTINLDRVWA